MDRRSFFRSMIGGVAASAAVRTWPFRIYSFPTNLAMPLPDFTEKYIKSIRFMGSEIEKLNGLIDGWNEQPHFIRLMTPHEEVKVIRLKTEHGIDWTCD